ISSKDPENSGVFAFYPTKDVGKLSVQPLLVGKAKYSRLTWDETQMLLAFLAEQGGDGAEPGQVSLYIADRAGVIRNRNRRGGGPVAVELVSTATPGLKDGMVLSDRGALTFSDNGEHLFFGVAPPPPVVDKGAAKDKAVVELWHWNDDYIQ